MMVSSGLGLYLLPLSLSTLQSRTLARALALLLPCLYGKILKVIFYSYLLHQGVQIFILGRKGLFPLFRYIPDRTSPRLNSSPSCSSRMPASACTQPHNTKINTKTKHPN